jgi:putative cardiolipin synthase
VSDTISRLASGLWCIKLVPRISLPIEQEATNVVRSSPSKLHPALPVILAMLLNACATVNFDYPKQESYAYTQTEDTELGEITGFYEQNHLNQSGFELQNDGIKSFAARLALADEAQLSIDAQYYLIKDDLVGFIFVGELLDAADRGVRVRLLLDDVFTQGFDAGFMALDSHPNFEIRVFNPWASRKNRFADLFSFSRLNRRMHTKSYTVDNEITIVGGRNIADEYYGASYVTNFGDIDVMGIGPVVNEVSGMFDEFWNNRLAMPIAAVAKAPDDPAAVLTQLRLTIGQYRQASRNTKYASAVIADFDDYLAADESIFEWAPYVLAYDAPEKADKKLAAEAASIIAPLEAAVARATERLIVISPYFVPRKAGIEYFRELRERGLEIIIVTNSLAANNHTIVHSGYAPSRKPLLEMGVQIYEVRATTSIADLDRAGTENTHATLHSKAFVVDSNEIFVGSFNWDPRSVNLNTEAGIIIDSAELTEELLDQITRGEGKSAYEVVLNDKGQLRWVDRSGAEDVVLNKEPDTTWGKRFRAGFMEILPVRGQL